jgi:hypothetical protein
MIPYSSSFGSYILWTVIKKFKLRKIEVVETLWNPGVYGP